MDPTQTDTTTHRRQVDRTRDMKRRVIEATFDVLVESGYAELTIGRVAKQAGVSNGAPLHHFGSRDAMLEAAARAAANNIVRQTISAIRRSRDADDPLEEVILILWREVCSARDGRILAELIDYSRHAPRLKEVMKRLWTRQYRLISRMGQRQKHGYTRSIPPARLILLAQWMMRGMALDVHLGAPAELFESYIRTWVRGLKT